MFIGKGMLVAKGGSRWPVIYESVGAAEHGWAGHLFCSLSEFDLGRFARTVYLECEGGIALTVEICVLSDRRVGFAAKIIN